VKKHILADLRIRNTTLSIGIPAFNEEATITQLLYTVLKQPTNGFVLKEIIVNTSGSNDSTEAKVQDLSRLDSRIKLISKGTRSGKASALNDILRSTKSDLLLLLDADVVIEKNAIKNLVEPLLQNEKVGVCSGNTMPLKGLGKEDFFDFASLFIRELHHELCSYLMREGLAPKVNGTFYALRTGIMKSFPKFVVSDDEYVSWHAQKLGYSVVYVPSALVFTRDPHSFHEFLIWQSRVIAGQLYMKRHFHYDVPTVSISLAVKGGGLFKLLNKHRKKTLSLLMLSLLGALSFILAYAKLARSNVPYTY